jgi:hypothetical protein
MSLEITSILVEIFDPPIMHVTGFFLFATIKFIAFISFLQVVPHKIF